MVVAVTPTPLISILALIVTVQPQVILVSSTVLEADVAQALLQENVGDLLLVTAVQVLVGAGVQAGAVLAVEVDTRRGGDVGNLSMNCVTICFLTVRTTS